MTRLYQPAWSMHPEWIVTKFFVWQSSWQKVRQVRMCWTISTIKSVCKLYFLLDWKQKQALIWLRNPVQHNLIVTPEMYILAFYCRQYVRTQFGADKGCAKFELWNSQLFYQRNFVLGHADAALILGYSFTPYAFMLGTVKTCKAGSVAALSKYQLLNFISVTIDKSRCSDRQQEITSSGITLSHSKCCRHSNCIIIFPLTVAGLSEPRGSYNDIKWNETEFSDSMFNLSAIKAEVKKNKLKSMTSPA